jgi:hypothetical protein
VNGELCSFLYGDTGANAINSGLNPGTIGLFPILGLSALLTGGGRGLKTDSLLTSPDLRGGGGDGGLDADNEGDLPASSGVLGRLGIRKCLGEEPPGLGEKEASVDR